MTAANLKQIVRHIFSESPHAATRGYIFANPGTKEIVYHVLGGNRIASADDTVRHLALAIISLDFISAFAINKTQPGGMLGFRTATLIFAPDEALALTEKIINAYIGEKTPDSVAVTVGRSWDPPETKVIQ
jgi:hypothetical protein